MSVQTFDPRTILRDELSELTAYAPSAGHFEVRLDANEAPPLLSATARRQLSEISAKALFERYPDAGQKELRKAIARSLGVEPTEVLAGVGSDEIITLLLTVATRTKKQARVPTILTTTPTFVMYRLSARVRGQRVVEVPLDSDWDLAVDSMLTAIEMSEPNVVFIASPNNPTGTMMSRDRLEAVIRAARNSLVVVDEAYVDYADRTQLDLLQSYENVAILRTLSKVGFAALRVGWLVAKSSLIAELDKARLPYNLPSVSQALASFVLTDLRAELDSTIDAVQRERARVEAALLKLPGTLVAPSQANFLWLSLAGSAEETYEALKKHSVLVRSFHGRGGRLERCLRVTIGTPEQNDRFLDALAASV